MVTLYTNDTLLQDGHNYEFTIFSYSNKRNKDKMFKNNYLETLFKHKGKV